MFKTDAAVGKPVNVWRLEMIRAITTHAPDAQIVREDEDDVRFRGGCRRKQTVRRRQQQSRRREDSFHDVLSDGRLALMVTVSDKCLLLNGLNRC